MSRKKVWPPLFLLVEDIDSSFLWLLWRAGRGETLMWFGGGGRSRRCRHRCSMLKWVLDVGDLGPALFSAIRQRTEETTGLFKLCLQIQIIIYIIWINFLFFFKHTQNCYVTEGSLTSVEDHISSISLASTNRRMQCGRYLWLRRNSKMSMLDGFA